MNTRRQTIWIVSMLSLMVILSAYYLFTDKVDETNLASQEQTDQNDQIDVSEVGSGDENVSDADQTGADNADAQDADQTDTNANDSAKADDGDQATSEQDEQVLKEMEAQGVNSSDYFVSSQLKRNDKLQADYDRLMNIITDTKSSDDEMAKAYEEMTKLEDKQQKLEDLDEELAQDFSFNQAVVLEEQNGHYLVTVQADKLQKSQAVSIIDKVSKEMNLQPYQIKVKIHE